MARHPAGMALLVSLSLLALLFGALALAAAWILYESYARAARWPSTDGVVLSSEVRKTLTETYAKRQQQLSWEPLVTYQYSVGGKRYVGTRISSRVYRKPADAGDADPPRELSALADRYAVGVRVGVHYNPENPSSAFLEIDRFGPLLFGAVGGVLVLTGLALLAANLLREKASGRHGG